jgi:hypothetical protein
MPISGHPNAFVVVQLAPRGAQYALRLVDVTALLNKAARKQYLGFFGAR